MTKWSIRNAAIWGAGFGVAYIASTTIYSGESHPIAKWIALILGGGIGGVILFTAVAAIRNAAGRA